MWRGVGGHVERGRWVCGEGWVSMGYVGKVGVG